MCSFVRIKLPTYWYDDGFLGFVIFSVLEYLLDRIICHLSSGTIGYRDLRDFDHDFHWKASDINSEHVWLDDYHHAINYFLPVNL